MLLQRKILWSLSAEVDVADWYLFSVQRWMGWVDGMAGREWKMGGGEGSMITMSFPILLSLNQPAIVGLISILLINSPSSSNFI